METKMTHNANYTNVLKALIKAYIKDQSEENLTNLVSEICVQNKITDEQIKELAREEIKEKINELATKDFVKLEIANLKIELKEDIHNLKIELNNEITKIEKKLLYYFVGICLTTIISTNAGSILSFFLKLKF
ncbi:hypothetical protein [Campylobacter insulaenigrae]|uniref:hypothetical protein n=1 Tax=Campylobacter insulaenigrae TaxID=260714 RepID=UPI00215344B0|nr:hypothetical protein [Campylobacter insulaenigrae]MCR6574340.1 hypothetical protein [Campylobacter insulaenigrae]